MAVAPHVYAPPTAPIAGAADFTDPDLFEVQIFRGEGQWQMVAAIELVSEANKDRPETRRAFAVKCASYLQRGISVVFVDVVTTRSADFHTELGRLLHWPAEFHWTSPSGLSAISYRAVAREEEVHLEVWPHALAVGTALPTVPLWLAPDLAVPLELELTYAAACQSLRLDNSPPNP
ncbi:hypothetical protein FRUB_02511 [Fimbriiglobus ruber]|uniref:DUF4058 domain-containing protein n=1 Tax=Fimbriiglobus ruber TaxID=1908690 RepID=A0A225DCR0_9BACT|nr:hypothetical protein FRUB_08891 [Fimbriiglobus ruber]OWK42914.1 hypothetical protein FRUB_02511 [Fimbriiglobus ruber]